MTTLRHMPCAEFVERVTDYLEGAMSAEDLARLEEHLDACAKCAHYLQQLRDTLDLTGELRDEDLSPAMRDELGDVFSRWQDERG